MSAAETIKQRGREMGFDLVGVAPLAAWKDLEFSRQWVEKGYGGVMRYLENPKRQDPRRLLPSAKSIICVGLIYNAPLPYSTEAGSGGLCARERVEEGDPQHNDATQGPRAWISRYAWGRDYHEVMRNKLERLRGAVEALAPRVETRVYVDTGPVVERAFARLSGIGWMGKNTCLINQAKGSWFFLGVMLTSLELAPDFPAPDRCGSCTRCLEACPTGALVEPYVMDASRCIAYFTIELKDSIPAGFRPAIGSNVYGCDICQDVCPWNSRQWSGGGGQLQESQPLADSSKPRNVATTELPEFQPLQIEAGSAELSCNSAGFRTEGCGARTTKDAPGRKIPKTEEADLPTSRRVEKQLCATFSGFSLFNPPLEALASLTEEDFRRIFARSPIKRAKYRGWLRNLCVAMGNSGARRFVPWLEGARQHGDPVVREHAEWALEKIGLRRVGG